MEKTGQRGQPEVKNRRHVPIRTCISCGLKRAKHELDRLSFDATGLLVIDARGRMHGRGAYLCKAESCREKLLKNRCLNRVFRTNRKIKVDLGRLV